MRPHFDKKIFKVSVIHCTGILLALIIVLNKDFITDKKKTFKNAYTNTTIRRVYEVKAVERRGVK